jgi:hypothetical protein
MIFRKITPKALRLCPGSHLASYFAERALHIKRNNEIIDLDALVPG